MFWIALPKNNYRYNYIIYTAIMSNFRPDDRRLSNSVCNWFSEISRSSASNKDSFENQKSVKQMEKWTIYIHNCYAYLHVYNHYIWG